MTFFKTTPAILNTTMSPPVLTLASGIPLNVRTRVWEGDDATYFVVEVDQCAYRVAPVMPGQIIYRAMVGGREEYVVREVVTDMLKNVWTVSCIDVVSWEKRMRLPPPKPPKFNSVEEADAWLEKFGG